MLYLSRFKSLTYIYPNIYRDHKNNKKLSYYLRNTI